VALVKRTLKDEFITDVSSTLLTLPGLLETSRASRSQQWVSSYRRVIKGDYNDSTGLRATLCAELPFTNQMDIMKIDLEKMLVGWAWLLRAL
jgi:hypothetical protein